MAIGICIVLLLIFVILYLKAKLMNYIMAMWMVENNFPTPEKEDAVLAKLVKDAGKLRQKCIEKMPSYLKRGDGKA